LVRPSIGQALANGVETNQPRQRGITSKPFSNLLQYYFLQFYCRKTGPERTLRRAAPAVAPGLLTLLQPFDNAVVNAMDLGGKVLVRELRSTVADDHIAIGSEADRCLLSGVKQTSHFKGVTTAFDPGCVKTCTRGERTELYSLVSSFGGTGQCTSFL
jgi:hypothetical protein